MLDAKKSNYVQTSELHEINTGEKKCFTFTLET